MSAIYNDTDAGDSAAKYQIQVATSSNFTTLYWDSGTTSMATTSQGVRSPDISYSGAALASSTTYYWRIKFWDVANKEGAWSTATSTFSLASGDTTIPVTCDGQIQNVWFSYDAVGNITNILDCGNAGTGKSVVFVYDDLHRLTSASTTFASSTPFAQTYTYDAIGNITSKSDIGPYSYAGTNYANPHAATTINGVTYRYDNLGNLASTSAGLLNVWDYRNRLTSSGNGSATTTYEYDAADERVKKTENGTLTRYFSDLYSTSGSTSTKNIFANDELIAVIQTGSTSTVSYIHNDHLRGTNVVTNASGTVTQTLDYYPYGSERISTGQGTTRHYIGEEADSLAGLSYLNARYYSGTRGQFLSQDPMFWSLATDLLTDPQQLNSYSYARNNPVNLADPSGLLTVVIPGTSYDKDDWSSSGAASTFISAVGKTFNETPQVLQWSGGDNSRARQDAANSLQSIVQDHPFADGEKLNIVGHSHGGNIGILFSQMTDRKIDSLVTLGTPVRSDYKPNNDMIGKHINLYSSFDPVQVLGGGFAYASMIRGALECGTFCATVGWYQGRGEFGPAGRTYPGAQNINETYLADNPIYAHGDLWKVPGIWYDAHVAARSK
ncbi:hypothetical protein A1D31_39320 [Bradyrhizobium liaoningense]|nr:hypothetical protein A1D31_39320 [Bradyrhizobium liaoningense]